MMPVGAVERAVGLAVGPVGAVDRAVGSLGNRGPFGDMGLGPKGELGDSLEALMLEVL